VGDDPDYDAAADEPGLAEGRSALPDEESLFDGVLVFSVEEPDDPSEDDVFSFAEPEPSWDEPEASDGVVCFVSFDEADSLAAGRLSFL
jgi:hypothetical protein